MEVIRDIPTTFPPPCVATIGFFDGVHAGHRFLIEQVKELATTNDLHSAVITFPVHPRKVMNSYYKPDLLTTYEEKIELLGSTGIDYCFVPEFTSGLSLYTAREFMQHILKEKYNVHTLVVGYDHQFGHNRSEDFNDYVRFGKELNIDVVRARACSIGDVHTSSSVIRRLLHEGEVEKAAHCLGYSYSLDGFVAGGYKIGRSIGFPTANLRIDNPEKLIPMNGVYAVKVEVKGETHYGMLNIGFRPTFANGSDRSIEVHILQFDSDIYDAPIRISFIRYLRSEMKFNTKEELRLQLAKDAEMVSSLK